MAVGDPGVDGGRADVAVAEVVLDELERGAGVQEMGGDRVPKRVGRQPPGQARLHPVADEAGLDLPALERTEATREEGLLRLTRGPGQVGAKQPRSAPEEDLLAPAAALEPPDEQPAPLEVDVATAKEQHLAHPQPMLVHEREERPIARVVDDREEARDLILGEVARQVLVGERLDGQRRSKRQRRLVATAPISRRAQSVRDVAAQAPRNGAQVNDTGGQPRAFRVGSGVARRRPRRGISWRGAWQCAVLLKGAVAHNHEA